MFGVLFFLRVRKGFSEGSETEQENIPPELLAESKLCVSAVQIVQETDGPEALVELEVVKVVELRGG